MTITQGPTDSSDEIVILIHGDLDLTTVDAAEHQINQLVPSGAPQVVVDLSDVAFIDSCGLALLLQLDKKTASFTIRRPSRPVTLVFEAAGLTNVLRIEQ